MGTALLWIIIQQVLEISYRRFGKTYRSIFKDQLGLKKIFENRPIACPESL